MTVAEPADTTPPAAPEVSSISPQPATVDDSVTVAGSVESGSTVSVTVDGTEVCSVTAGTDGTFSCSFVVTEDMDGAAVMVAATDDADNTSTATNAGSLDVDPVAVDPEDPTVTLDPAQPVVGESAQINVTGEEGEQVVVRLGDEIVCETTIGADGTATCEWTPDAEGSALLEITVGNRTIDETVTVRPADTDDEDDDDDDDDGSLDLGSLENLFGGSGGSSGSLGSLSSLGS